MVEPTTGAKLSYDDYLRIPEDGRRHEIIDGVHYVTASPATRHQQLVGELYFRIRQFLVEHDLGEVFLSPFDVLFSNIDVVAPDLLYIRRERWSVLTKANVQGSPDLVVEVLSPSTSARDRGIKRDLYERFEVSEYWIVDPDAETIEVFTRHADGRLLTAAELSRAAGDELASPLFPGWTVPLDGIFSNRLSL